MLPADRRVTKPTLVHITSSHYPLPQTQNSEDQGSKQRSSEVGKPSSGLAGAVPISISRKVQCAHSGRPRKTKYSSRLPANTQPGTASSYLKNPSLSPQATRIATILSLLWGEHAGRKEALSGFTYMDNCTNKLKDGGKAVTALILLVQGDHLALSDWGFLLSLTSARKSKGASSPYVSGAKSSNSNCL